MTDRDQSAYADSIKRLTIAMREMLGMAPAAIFCDRLDQAEAGLGSASRAAESFGAVVRVADRGQVQASIAPAYVAADKQCPIGLARRSETVGNAREGTNHATKVEPADGQ
jgi:hypothetical protein